MKTRCHNYGLFFVLFALLLAGCGGSGGAPGADSGDTGIVIKSVSITGDDGFGADSGELEVDSAIHLCPTDFTTAEDGLFMATATMTIDAGKVNPNINSDPFPASVEQCTVTYLKANEDPASPVIPSMTQYPGCTLIDSTENTCVVSLMDIQRKIDYQTAIDTGLNTPSEQPTHYIAQFKCTYMGPFGKAGSFTKEYGIYVSDWNHCQ